MNCPDTVDDVNRGTAIYGTQVAIIQGKMTRRRPQHITKSKRIPILSPFLLHHPTIQSSNWVELSIDDTVIRRFEELASREGMSPIINGDPIF